MPQPAQEALFDATVRHQIKLLRFSRGEADRAARLLRASEAEIVARLREDLTEITEARLRSLLADVRRLRAAAFGKVSEELAATLAEVASAEAEWEVGAIGRSSPVELSLTAPTAAALKAAVGSPINGIPLDSWLGDLSDKDVLRLEQQVRLGMVQGETVDQIVGRVRGTRAGGYEDGVLSLTRRNAQTIVRTAVNHVSNSARESVWEANSDILQGVRWVATLDGRTSDVCRARDGHVYPVSEGPRPPAHPGCRSTTVAVLDGKAIVGNRPMVRDTRARREREVDFRQEAKIASGERWRTMAAEERLGAVRAQRDSWTAANVGTVPSDLTYDAWLRRQPADFQDDVLGPGRGELFRGGLALDKFVDQSGSSYTLAQLREELRREAQR